MFLSETSQKLIIAKLFERNQYKQSFDKVCLIHSSLKRTAIVKFKKVEMEIVKLKNSLFAMSLRFIFWPYMSRYENR